MDASELGQDTAYSSRVLNLIQPAEKQSISQLDTEGSPRDLRTHSSLAVGLPMSQPIQSGSKEARRRRTDCTAKRKSCRSCHSRSAESDGPRDDNYIDRTDGFVQPQIATQKKEERINRVRQRDEERDGGIVTGGDE